MSVQAVRSQSGYVFLTQKYHVGAFWGKSLQSLFSRNSPNPLLPLLPRPRTLSDIQRENKTYEAKRLVDDETSGAQGCQLISQPYPSFFGHN